MNTETECGIIQLPDPQERQVGVTDAPRRSMITPPPANAGSQPPTRYIVFAGSQYYPTGGAYDIQSTHTTKEAAVDAANAALHQNDWAHVYDIATGAITHAKSPTSH